jgi:hypothetical protein
MQTKLEKKAIEKRLESNVKNDFNAMNSYDEKDAKKGGETTGSLFTHTKINPDMYSGGSDIDAKIRTEQLLMVAPDQERYHKDKKYGEDVIIDTSKNIGQIIIN